MRPLTHAFIILFSLFVPLAQAQIKSQLGREELRDLNGTLKSSLLKAQQNEFGTGKPKLDLANLTAQSTKSPAELEQLLDPKEERLTTEQLQKLLREHRLNGDVQMLKSSSFIVPGWKRRIEQTQQVIPGNEKGGGPLNLALASLALEGRPGLSEAAAQKFANSADKTTCPSAVVARLFATKLAVKASSAKVETDNQLNAEEQRLRRYLSTSKADISKFEDAKSIEALQRFEAAWRDVLENCFASPHSFKSFETLKARIGTFVGNDKVPFCTGLLVADGVVLTARHCFLDIDTSPKSPYTRVQFISADGKLAVNLDAEAAKTAAGPTHVWDDDQLLVSIPKQDIELLPIPLMADVQPFYADAPKTQLLLIAALPLARDLAADKFPSGFVISKQPNTCFVAFQGRKCLTHMCSVTPGSSGASIFSDEPTPKWLGIHVGPESKGNSCSPLGTDITSNYAIRNLKSELSSYIK
jgi:V8-like Glu-specific endopeptidase